MTRAFVFSERWLWTFPLVYLVHLVDERLWPPGTANWATANSSFYFTNEAWFWVNAPSMMIMLSAAVLVRRRKIPEWVVIAMALHLALHGAMRVGGTLVYGSISPGLLTGVALCLPLSIPVLVRGWLGFPGRTFILGLLVGILSFQPLWHLILHPVLPEKPAA